MKKLLLRPQSDFIYCFIDKNCMKLKNFVWEKLGLENEDSKP